MNNDSSSAYSDKVPDPFDLDALRINPETGNLGSIRQIFTTSLFENQQDNNLSGCILK